MFVISSHGNRIEGETDSLPEGAAEGDAIKIYFDGERFRSEFSTFSEFIKKAYEYTKTAGEIL